MVECKTQRVDWLSRIALGYRMALSGLYSYAKATDEEKSEAEDFSEKAEPNEGFFNGYQYQ